MAARRIQVRPAVLDHLTGTLGATGKLTPARGRSGSDTSPSQSLAASSVSNRPCPAIGSPEQTAVKRTPAPWGRLMQMGCSLVAQLTATSAIYRSEPNMHLLASRSLN